jgi:N4-gp56 family major capsid protein
MPRNGGRFLRMRRYNPLPTALVPLGNTGVTPPPTQLTAIDIDAQISFYGQYIQLNEQVSLQNQDPKMYGVVKFSLIDLEAYGIS